MLELVSITLIPPQVPELLAKCVDDNGIIEWENNGLMIMEALQLMYLILIPHM
jgi:hypothetical protein